MRDVNIRLTEQGWRVVQVGLASLSADLISDTITPSGVKAIEQAAGMPAEELLECCNRLHVVISRNLGEPTEENHEQSTDTRTGGTAG